MNTWILLITENLAEILSFIFLVSMSIYLLQLKNDNFKDVLTWNVFIMGISFLMIYVFLDITTKNFLISNTLSWLRDFALMLSGIAFAFILCVSSNLSLGQRSLRKKVKKNE